MLVCLAVICGVALYVVTWRNADSGRPVPTKIAIMMPLLAGGLCYGVGTMILRMLGLSLILKRDRESSDHPEESETTRTDDR